MNDQHFKSLREQTICHDSDNEFYDAFETMEHKVGTENSAQVAEGLQKLNLKDNDVIEEETIENYSDSDEDFMTMKTDFKDFDSKEFLSRHDKLTEIPDDQDRESAEEFVPLHESLNKKLNTDKETEHVDANEAGDNEEEEDTEKQDPFYVDEQAMEAEFANLTDAELEEHLAKAQEFKTVGNTLFKEEKYIEAVGEYTKSLRTCPLNYTKERSIFYSNRSICFFKMNDDDRCIKECGKSLELNSNFVKPLLRRAECNQKLDKLDEVLTDYQKLSELEPSNSSYKRKCFELEEAVKERNEKLKTEMMGKLKDLGNMCLKPFGLSTENFQFVQDPATGSYSVNFNQK